MYQYSDTLTRMNRGTSTGAWVSDEVWTSVATESARLDADERRVFGRAVVGVVLALVVAVLVWWLGAVSPHLTQGNSSGWSTDSSAHTAEYEFELVNRGILPVSVTAMDLATPGVRVTSLTPPGARIGRAASQHVRLGVQVEDCTAAAYAAKTHPDDATERIGVTVSRPWGHVHTTVGIRGGQIADLVLMTCGVEPAG
jgi:hypothetical protein